MTPWEHLTSALKAHNGHVFCGWCAESMPRFLFFQCLIFLARRLDRGGFESCDVWLPAHRADSQRTFIYTA